VRARQKDPGDRFPPERVRRRSADGQCLSLSIARDFFAQGCLQVSEVVRQNIIANYLGQGWSALMGFAFLPLYVKYLGMEAVGLIGLFTVMQAWLALLDMGMTPTLNREMARFTAGAHSPQSIRDLLRSLEIICFSLAAFIALVVWGASGYLASDWLKAERLPTGVVADALAIMAFVVAARFCEGIYRGSMFGLQRQVAYNCANALLATLRHGGALAVLAWVSPTIAAFFTWQAAMSLLSVSVFALCVHKILPRAVEPARFSRDALAGIWRFAGGMMGITFLALLLTQVDKVLLSRMLRLEDFGYYSLAAIIAGAIYMIIGPVTQAIYPRMVELAINVDKSGLAAIYHESVQLVVVAIAPPVLALTVFAEGAVFAWSGDVGLAGNTAPLLVPLVLGTFLNGLMWMPYHCQLAHGWTSLTVKVNLVAVSVLVPAIFWIVPTYGGIGAAWIWVALNVGYVLIAVQIMHRRILIGEKLRWYVGDVIAPSGGAAAIVLLSTALRGRRHTQRAGDRV